MNFKQLNEGFERRYGTVEEPAQDLYESLRKDIKQILRQLNEAKMSDEDKADSDALRNLYKKIGGKKTSFNKDEKALLKKYGLDAWGYMGDTKVVTADNRDLKQGNVQHRLTTYHDEKHDEKKMNFADRARKMPRRMKDADIAGLTSYDKTYQQANNDYINRKMSQNYRDVKFALDDKKRAQQQLDKDYWGKEIEHARDRFKKDMGTAQDQYADEMGRNAKNISDNADAIQAIKNKYKGNKKLESLMTMDEAKMSDEDRRDNEILQGLMRKKRYGHRYDYSRLSDEEKSVLDKYGLSLDYDIIKNYYNDPDFDMNKHQGSARLVPYPVRGNVDRMNLADRARKMDARGAREKGENPSPYANIESERRNLNKAMGQDVEDMKQLLNDRKYLEKQPERIAKDFADSSKNALDNYNREVGKYRNYADNSKADAQRRINKADATINRALKRESMLDETAIIRSDSADLREVPTNLSGKINNEILRSVIGQLSDGMWENDPNAEKYWLSIEEISPNNAIVVNDGSYVSNSSRRGSLLRNPFKEMSDGEVRNFFANKIKRIAQQELTDNNMNPFTNWNENCDFESRYLSYNEDVTIGDAYKAFKQLKGGKDFFEDFKVGTGERAKKAFEGDPTEGMTKDDYIDWLVIDKGWNREDAEMQADIFYEGTNNRRGFSLTEKKKKHNHHQTHPQQNPEEVTAGDPEKIAQYLNLLWSEREGNKKQKKNRPPRPNPNKVSFYADGDSVVCNTGLVLHSLLKEPVIFDLEGKKSGKRDWIAGLTNNDRSKNKLSAIGWRYEEVKDKEDSDSPAIGQDKLRAKRSVTPKEIAGAFRILLSEVEPLTYKQPEHKETPDLDDSAVKNQILTDRIWGLHSGGTQEGDIAVMPW